MKEGLLRVSPEFVGNVNARRQKAEKINSFLVFIINLNVGLGSYHSIEAECES